VATPENATGRTGPIVRLLQVVALAVVATLIAFLTWRVFDAQGGSDFRGQVEAGAKPPAPAFDLHVVWDRSDTWPDKLRQGLADKRLSLAELRGYPLVLNFWASWCKPCKEEAPILAASAEAHAGEVVFLGIDIQDFKSDARRFLTRYDVNYVSVRDSSEDTYRQYGLTGVPETYYVDDGGRVLAHSLGGLSREELERGIAAITEGTG
jgi:cytochrome c biogenesis protein CcmG/thiol:disulfide interchange protein DsbE